MLMDTVVQITVAGTSDEQARAAMSEAFAEIERIDAQVSSYRQQSLIALVNREGHSRNILLEKEIVQLLREAVAVSEQSSGAFDVTIWPVAKLWAFDKGGSLPDKTVLADALTKVGYKNLSLDVNNDTVGFMRDGMGIDLGAIAKGWAVDRAMQVLTARGIVNAIIDAGGDLRIVGGRPGKGFWRIGVQHPRQQGELLLSLRPDRHRDRDLRRLRALLHGGRGALSPHPRPGDGDAGDRLQERHRPRPDGRRGGRRRDRGVRPRRRSGGSPSCARAPECGA